MDASAIRCLIEGRQAAARREKVRSAESPPSSEWSISLSLSLIKAAEKSAFAGRGVDPIAEREDEAVRETWRRLRERW